MNKKSKATGKSGAKSQVEKKAAIEKVKMSSAENKLIASARAAIEKVEKDIEKKKLSALAQVKAGKVNATKMALPKAHSIEICEEIRFGTTKRSLFSAPFTIGNLRGSNMTGWRVDVSYVGATSPYVFEYEARGNTAFNAMIMGLAAFRQWMRSIQEIEPGIKFFVSAGGDWEESSVDDIFWTHDCVASDD